MPIGIVTDSTCDLPPEIVREHKIAVIPMLVHFGSREYRDGIDLSRQRFYSELPAIEPPPTTAAPGVEVLRQTYEQLAADGATEILSIHISHKLSAVVDVATLAAQSTSGARVTVFDSRQLSLGTGFEVQSAARAATAGRSMAEILSLLEEQISRTYTFAALDTLEFMRRGGRMNPAIAALGGILQIKPILKMYDGVPTAERVRTRSGAIRRVKELLTQHAPFDTAAVVHTGAEARAKVLLEEVRDQLPQGEIWVREISPVLGAHIGPGVVGLACVSARI